MKHLTPALLRWVANGDQGQNTLNTVFLLTTGRSFFIVSWRTPNHFVQLQRSMESLLKRSVTSFFMLLSIRDSTKPNGPQAGLRPSAEQQALYLVPMEGSDYCLAQSAPVMAHMSGSAPSSIMAL